MKLSHRLFIMRNKQTDAKVYYLLYLRDNRLTDKTPLFAEKL